MVEERFRARLSAIDASEEASESLVPSRTTDDLAAHEPPQTAADQSVPSNASDTGTRQKARTRVKKKSRSDVVRSLGKTVRLRDKDHRKFVLRQACLVCGRVPSDPHHLTFTQSRALGRRVSDEFIVPVCRLHYRELHRAGDEAAWWRRLNIDPLPVALRLWQQTRGDGELTPTRPHEAVKTSGVSIRDQARASRDARIEPNLASQAAASDEASENAPQGSA